MSHPSPTKQKILEAAAQVCTQHGASNLTLDRVAEQAALSKGGLLYHYPNKRALLEGMLEHLMDTIRSRQVAHEQALAGSPRPFATSVLLAETEQIQVERAMAQAILAVAAEDPKLLAAVKPVMAEWIEHAGKEDTVSLAIVLATLGLRFLYTMDLLPSGPAPEAALTKRLRTLLEQAP